MELIELYVKQDKILKYITNIIKKYQIECYIAGGYTTNLYLGISNETSDIDIFFKNENELERACSIFKNIFEYVNISKYAENFRFKNKLIHFHGDIQLIKYAFSDNEIECISRFDFTICQFIYNPNTGKFYTTDQAINDIKNKILRYSESGHVMRSLFNQGRNFNFSIQNDKIYFKRILSN